jgi:hypothetical protein
MAHHEHEHQHSHSHDPSHGHEHGHQHGHRRRGLHKHWLTWVVVGLMLAAILLYVMSDDERLQPGSGKPGQMMPAAPAPAAGP